MKYKYMILNFKKLFGRLKEQASEIWAVNLEIILYESHHRMTAQKGGIFVTP